MLRTDLVTIAPCGAREQPCFSEAAAIDDHQKGAFAALTGEKLGKTAAGSVERMDAVARMRQALGKMGGEARQPHMRGNEDIAGGRDHRNCVGPLLLRGEVIDVMQGLDLLGYQQSQRFA